METRLRAAAIKFARADHPDDEKEPWGLCLLRAIRSECHFWQEYKDVLIPLRSSAQAQPRALSNAQSSPQTPPKQAQQQLQNKDKLKTQAPARKDWLTESQDKNGYQICKWFNDQRGCDSKRCPKGHSNVCDVSIGGRACGASTHNRKTHDPDKHGKPTTRK